MMTCIVAYDIEDDRTRSRISKFLEGHGVRLQKSVFAVEIERHAFRRFRHKLKDLAGEDGRVAVFRLCAGCTKNALQLCEEIQRIYVF